MTNDGGRDAAVAERRRRPLHRRNRDAACPPRGSAFRGTSSWPTSTTTPTSTCWCRASAVAAARCSATTAPARSPTTRGRCRSTPTTTSSSRWISTATAFSTWSRSTTAILSAENTSSRREHVFSNDGKGRFRDATPAGGRRRTTSAKTTTWSAFLDADSDGDADFVVGSLSGPDRLLVNDGKGRLTGPPRRVRRRAHAGHARPGPRRSRRRRPDRRRAGAGRASEGGLTSGYSPAAASRPTRRPRRSPWSARATPGRPAHRARARIHDRKSPSAGHSNGSVWWSSGRHARCADALVWRVSVACRLARRRSARRQPSACARPTPPATAHALRLEW